MSVQGFDCATEDIVLKYWLLSSGEDTLFILLLLLIILKEEKIFNRKLISGESQIFKSKNLTLT